ncbi:hypothetical protein M0804_015488 [Polistes exclamans]|nr:hypothetical protein M0804_015488 [Polistes exclamans]
MRKKEILMSIREKELLGERDNYGFRSVIKFSQVLLYNRTLGPASRINLTLNGPSSLINRTHTYGQTKQKLKKIKDQHKNDRQPNNAQKTNTTTLAEHHFKTGHNFQFDTATILDLKDNWYKRNISEMYYITNNNTISYRTDTNNLNITHV